MPDPAEEMPRPRVIAVAEPEEDEADLLGDAEFEEELVEAVEEAEEEAEEEAGVADVAEAVAEAAGKVADTGTGAEPHAASACPVAWCPICLAVTAVQPLSPTVVEHLLKAGTELLLAFRGVLDARGDELTGQTPSRPASEPFEKIDLG